MMLKSFEICLVHIQTNESDLLPLHKKLNIKKLIKWIIQSYCKSLFIFCKSDKTLPNGSSLKNQVNK